MSAKKRIGVLMGGVSSEHDISLLSSANMLLNLDSTRYLGFPILITEANRWIWPGSGEFQAAEITPESLKERAFHPLDWISVDFPNFPHLPDCDVFLNGLHGYGGEDGRIQGFLDLCGKRHTGTGFLGSCLCMDKIATKRLLCQAGLPTPTYQILEQEKENWESLEKEFVFPMVLKVPNGGSSVGVQIAAGMEELKSIAVGFYKMSKTLLVEAFIPGREATCGYLEGHGSLPPTEIIPLNDEFFNYEAKYQRGRSREITPGNFDSKTMARMGELAEATHRTLFLKGYSRTDFRIDGDSIQILEANTLPGFTDNSLYPQELKAAGISVQDFLTRIIEAA